MKLTPRITLCALLLSCLPVLGLAAFTLYSTHSTLHETAEYQLLAAAQADLADIDEFVANAATDVSAWSSLHLSQYASTNGEDGETTRELTRLLRQYAEFAELPRSP